jgi:hypothetical protein
MDQKPPKFVRWAVLIGIVIVLNLFFFVARSFVIPEPQYDAFCPTRTAPAATEQACVAQDGVWVETPSDKSVTAVVKPNTEGYCDLYQKCQPLYDAARKQFEMYAFAFMLSVGVLSLIVGVLPIGSSIVSSGLSYGGVLSFVIASAQYWGEAENLTRLGISTIALIALLYIGIRRFRD